MRTVTVSIYGMIAPPGVFFLALGIVFAQSATSPQRFRHPH